MGGIFFRVTLVIRVALNETGAACKARLRLCSCRTGARKRVPVGQSHGWDPQAPASRVLLQQRGPSLLISLKRLYTFTV